MQPLTYIQKPRTDPWLVGFDSELLSQLTRTQYQQLLEWNYPTGMLPRICLVEREPIQFLAGFIAACAAEFPIFLGNPDWGTQEWQQLWAIAQPDLVWGSRNTRHRDTETGVKKLSLSLPSPPPPLLPSSPSPGWIMIPTGGSSGQLRFAIHTWQTLMASVQGFQAYFQVESVNSCCVLPLYHVSGLMQCLRSLTSGGRLLIQPFQALAAGQIPDIEPEQFFISLVPTQLKRLLANPKLSQWLSHFSTVLLGGAPAWAELLDQARALGIRLAPTYGMTETASQIATLKPEAFLAGEVGCGQVLPHARVLIRNLTGECLGCYQSGQIQIQAQSLALGYYPHLFSPDSRSTFLTDDLGFLDTEGALHVVGRDNDKLITGGENVFPAEVEAAIRSTDWVEDVCVIGLPDAQWGQVITAIYVPKHPQVSSDRLRADLTGKLSKFKHPKRWFAVDRIPRNAQGKVNRLKLAESLKPRIDGGSDDENERQEQL